MGGASSMDFFASRWNCGGDSWPDGRDCPTTTVTRPGTGGCGSACSSSPSSLSRSPSTCSSASSNTPSPIGTRCRKVVSVRAPPVLAGRFRHSPPRHLRVFAVTPFLGEPDSFDHEAAPKWAEGDVAAKREAKSMIEESRVTEDLPIAFVGYSGSADAKQDVPMEDAFQ